MGFTLLSKEEMEKLNTTRLLAYKRSLLSCRETPSWDNDNPKELTKDTKEWRDIHKEIKDILATREHIKK